MCLNGIRQLLRFGILLLAIFGCIQVQAVESNRVIHLTTTTSVVSSGLMNMIKPAFEADSGYTLKVQAYGTGRALRSARDGNADVIVVHSPAAEEKFMQGGYGLERLLLMKNEFVLVGPASDPAGVARHQDLIGAFEAIAANKALFISRGDDSGTHKKELEIWVKSGIEPYGSWYFEYGHGMGKTLYHADDTGAYTLVDRGTWLAKRKQLRLKQLFAGDAMLDNPYHIIAVNPEHHPAVNQTGAKRFIEWMTSTRGQDMIQNFTVDGEQLYSPASQP